MEMPRRFACSFSQRYCSMQMANQPIEMISKSEVVHLNYYIYTLPRGRIEIKSIRRSLLSGRYIKR